MNICELNPKPPYFEPFRRNRERYIPAKSGCYALTTFSKEVIYVGLTNNLRRRMNEHLDNPDKTYETKIGRAIFFFWIETPEINKIERTWLNIYIQHEGALPLLNKMYSPISV